jgi:preprotein translocase subunit SecE
MGPQGSRAGIMAKENRGDNVWLQVVRDLFKTEIYKRSQGRLVRQFTCLSIWVAFALAAYSTYSYMRVLATSLPPAMTYVVPSVLLTVGLWLGFRIVNLPSFADFLIAVEAEMNKVSWPSRTELVRASVVVIVLMFGLMIVLFTYDLALTALFKALGVTAG